MNLQNLISKLLKSLSISIIFNILSCNSAESDFEKAKTINNIEAYENFQKKYPNHQLSKEAISLRDKLAFEITKEINSTIAFEDFLKNYPESQFVKVPLLNKLQTCPVQVRL